MYEKPFIILNRIQCSNCKEILTSYHTHDFNCCKCKRQNTTCVDGGLDYLKRGGYGYKELSVHSDEPFEKIRQSLYRGTRGKNGDEELKYIVLCDMDNDYLLATIEYIKETGYGNKFLLFYEKEVEYRKLK